MNSRIVQPAASFQPPDTCTEHEECRAGQASNADLCRVAQAHYDKISTAAHEWHSAVPKAIAAYFADPERSRLEHEVIEKAKEWRELRLTQTETRFARGALMDALDDLIYFEAKQK